MQNHPKSLLKYSLKKTISKRAIYLKNDKSKLLFILVITIKELNKFDWKLDEINLKKE